MDTCLLANAGEVALGLGGLAASGFGLIPLDDEARNPTTVGHVDALAFGPLTDGLILRSIHPSRSRGSSGLFGVVASEVAFREGTPWLDELLAGLDANRRRLGELLAGQLPAVGYRLPQATYLAWLDCRARDLPAEPAEVFLEGGRVAVVAGSDFGKPGQGFVRFNFATRPDLVTEAVHRMAAAVKDVGRPEPART